MAKASTRTVNVLTLTICGREVSLDQSAVDGLLGESLMTTGIPGHDDLLVDVEGLDDADRLERLIASSPELQEATWKVAGEHETDDVFASMTVEDLEALVASGFED